MKQAIAVRMKPPAVGNWHEDEHANRSQEMAAREHPEEKEDSRDRAQYRVHRGHGGRCLDDVERFQLSHGFPPRTGLAGHGPRPVSCATITTPPAGCHNPARGAYQRLTGKEGTEIA